MVSPVVFCLVPPLVSSGRPSRRFFYSTRVSPSRSCSTGVLVDILVDRYSLSLLLDRWWSQTETESSVEWSRSTPLRTKGGRWRGSGTLKEETGWDWVWIRSYDPLCQGRTSSPVSRFGRYIWRKLVKSKGLFMLVFYYKNGLYHVDRECVVFCVIQRGTLSHVSESQRNR